MLFRVCAKRWTAHHEGERTRQVTHGYSPSGSAGCRYYFDTHIPSGVRRLFYFVVVSFWEIQNKITCSRHFG